MHKLIIATVAFVAMFSLEVRADNHCTGKAEDMCKADVGCRFQASETWTRDDGKARTSSARCVFDAKLAREALGKVAAPVEAPAQ